ncbi:serine/threonine-protein phosphatase [Roseovarius faecimaris]|uniref:Serine/threonine-protein phosphatase n=1 Tax=Roseovarius faecimaris TaxID=2494550 RepID=A0A6I6J675_9RHOB|nr:protein phosphatase 2C domain-containing protein [Roseovarius faecimaris]QGY00279.1 serine/threonine-protein phosphatase [Roseovarius faecimaris]
MANLSYDTAMSIDIGRRERQEDALASDFPSGQAFGFVVLADGMGGHAAGDMASKIVVTEVFSELKLKSSDPEQLEHSIGDVLKGAAAHANQCVGHYAHEHAQSHGMGSTLLAPVLIEDRLYWVSVGDSPLYLFRDGRLTRLNENHALCSQIEYLVASGIMDREEAQNYPDQSCLTSVLIGGEIAQVDCPSSPMQLKEGDILIAASDGIQFISEAQIEGVLRFQQKSTAEQISAALTKEIQKLDDPDQDNLSICVIKLLPEGGVITPPSETHTLNRIGDGKTETITILARVTRRKKTAVQ